MRSCCTIRVSAAKPRCALGGAMVIHAKEGTLRVRLESEFGLDQSRRLMETLEAFGPVSRLIVDFSGIQESRDASLALLARTLASIPGELALSGVTLHQARVLRYLGVDRVHP